MRKTIKVKELIDQVNRRNRFSTCDPKVRQGWNSLLESILHANKCYFGYNYYESKELGSTITPGIAWNNKHTNKDTYVRPNDNDRDNYKPIFPDETRRFYYYHHKLNK